MIREIRVSGFKSLSGFELIIHPGLKVLVGPNGAGKTSIIRFFDFLSYLQRNALPEAVSKAGGAGDIFRKVGDLAIEREINIRVRGSGAEVDRWVFPPNQQQSTLHLAYEIELGIRFSETDNLLGTSKNTPG
jgi:predicted ATPase